MAEVKAPYDFVFDTIYDAQGFFYVNIKNNYFEARDRYIKMMDRCYGNCDQSDEGEIKFNFDCNCGNPGCLDNLNYLDKMLHNIGLNMDSLHALLERFVYGDDHEEIHRLANLIASNIQQVLDFEDALAPAPAPAPSPLVVHDDGTIVEGVCVADTEFGCLFD
jgi:hypothetical protein